MQEGFFVGVELDGFGVLVVVVPTVMGILMSLDHLGRVFSDFFVVTTQLGDKYSQAFVLS